MLNDEIVDGSNGVCSVVFSSLERREIGQQIQNRTVLYVILVADH